jgi:glycosyltransferase involved in cell wall biosynthesis
MDILAFPTYREGLPNVLLEASAMKLAIVATNVPGCTDVVIDAETGTLVAAKDAAALTSGIRNYLDSPHLRERHGSAARNRVLRVFQQEAIWQALVEEYACLLACRQSL